MSLKAVVLNTTMAVAALLLLVLPALLVPQAGDAQQPASNTEYSA